MRQACATYLIARKLGMTMNMALPLQVEGGELVRRLVEPRWWVFSSSRAVFSSHRGGYSAGSSAAGARSGRRRGDQSVVLL
jgi:hypothetical protein